MSLSSSPWITFFILMDAVGFVALLWSIYAYCRRKKANRDAVMKEKSNDRVADQAMEGNKRNEERTLTTPSDQDPIKKLEFVDHGVGGFSLDDLLKAPAEGLGKGSFGASYKAVLDDGRAFVVKRLRDLSPLTNGEFAKHVKAIAAARHPNLLPLVGYYCSMEEKLLVYAFAQRGNLFDRIHGGKGETTRTPFNWHKRLFVAKSVARAMEYLHNKATKSCLVPHGNLKSSNILLDADDVALVSDYGLLPLISAPLAPHRMAAYTSPEYHHGRRVCKKSDVWSYGCLLLELVTGKMPVHSTPRGIEGVELVNWVHRAVREEWTCEVFDKEIWSRRGGGKGMFQLLQVALSCCERSLDKRPEMAEVAREVEGIMAIGEDLEEVEEEEDVMDVSFGNESNSTNGSG